MFELWQELYYLKVSDYMLKDNTSKLEARINKVKIHAKYQEEWQTPKYNFHIWEWTFTWTDEDLFFEKADAKIAAEIMINSIEILMIDEIEEQKNKDANILYPQQPTNQW